MKRLSRNELQGRNGQNENALQGLSNFSNELCTVINETEENKREAAFSALLKNYKKHISLSKKQLSRIVDGSVEKVKKHADVLSINIENSQFLNRLRANGFKQQPARRGQDQVGRRRGKYPAVDPPVVPALLRHAVLCISADHI